MSEHRAFHPGRTMLRLRKTYHFTQAQMADFLGVSRQLVSHFEQGRSCLTDTLEMVAAAFGMGFVEFLETYACDEHGELLA